MSPVRADDGTDGKAGEDKVMSAARTADIEVLTHGKDMTAHAGGGYDKTHDKDMTRNRER